MLTVLLKLSCFQISELEQVNQRESQNNEILLAALQKHTGKTISLESIIQSGASSPLSHKDSTVDQNTEDEEDHDLLKENDDPKMDESYNNFLRLRKQLRRSIFKREEVQVVVIKGIDGSVYVNFYF